MKTSNFHYNLPEHLIAQHPPEHRTGSRLLHYSRQNKKITHSQFKNIIDFIEPNDCLIFNDTRVVPARLYGRKDTGGKVEVLIERLINNTSALAHIRASKTPKQGSTILLDDSSGKTSFTLQINGREGSLFVISSKDNNIAEMMEAVGHMPLPPYITRDDTIDDHSRYQTVYAKTPGAVAAPTAGLHFDEALMQTLKDKNIRSAFVTLHVGAGTFQPVRSENIEEHPMHTETLCVSEETVKLCQQTRNNGGRVIAVGTTAVRSLETASQNGQLEAFAGETKIFIYPGYEFKSVDAMITNFHLSESTLLMLVSAFAGSDEIRQCYQQAIDKEYRFFSYGDAMFIT